MGESREKTGAGAWGILFLVGIAFAVMVVFMMRATGDNPYQATAELTLLAEPDPDADLVETLAAGSVLMCHGPGEAHPAWLDCSDMIEKKFVRIEAMQPINEDAYDEARRAQSPVARD